MWKYCDALNAFIGTKCVLEMFLQQIMLIWFTYINYMFSWRNLSYFKLYYILENCVLENLDVCFYIWITTDIQMKPENKL